jgi:hypothetical protein
MKGMFILTVAVMTFSLLLSVASACITGDCTFEKTIVRGKVFDQSTNDNVAKADVEIICHGESGDVTKTTKTGPTGRYRVVFDQNECDYGDEVTVHAEKDGLTGTSEGTINWTRDGYCIDLDIGVVNVPLVPEFGAVVGVMTLMGSISIFFLIRKK